MTASPDTGSDDVPLAVTHREIREILATFARSDWTGMELEVRGIRVSVGRHAPPVPSSVLPSASAPSAPVAPPPPAPAPAPVAPVTPVAPAPVSPAATADRTGLVAVHSPAVGAFWVAPSPGQPPFVAVGDHVERDAQLAIVEVMKLMNPVVAPVAGEVVEICAANADLVEYEQVLVWLRPDE
ncbi:acetyl-CoA carboxylase biotin carboxyl carrier protein [Actinomycetospora sp. OC33-EN08]|uniref:Biotin carboxyl carrier protein of acetyl-CoA carboxylase n=1 Tax=Actinomycetospora aurantiaca TaxID=3129233 RepID=A0ABU8MMA1_9PSEU